METFFKVLIGASTFFIIINLIYSYITFSDFECPQCPICPQVKECKVQNPPSNLEITRYIHANVIRKLEDSLDSLKFLKDYVIFANGKKVKYDSDAESLLAKMRIELIENKKNINMNNIMFIQPNNQEEKEKFKRVYSLSEFPAPLIKFKNTDLFFGWIDSDYKWKILINLDKY